MQFWLKKLQNTNTKDHRHEHFILNKNMSKTRLSYTKQFTNVSSNFFPKILLNLSFTTLNLRIRFFARVNSMFTNII